MLRTLYAKLAVALLLIFTLVGVAFLAIARFATEAYYEEITQKLNGEIADYVVKEKQLIRDGEVDTVALESIAHMVMLVNPSVEIYLLDDQGSVLGYAAPDEKIRRRSVDLEPIRDFLNDNADLPIVGDDPRSPDGRKIFTVAPVIDAGAPAGYLYAILGGEKYDAAALERRGSYITQLSGTAVAASVSFAFLAALLMFAFLTRRLRRLTTSVESFEHGQIPEAIEERPDGDEIDRLALAFRRMATKIGEQMGKLTNMDLLRRELVTNVSHDLRTPLASMQGYIETVLLKQDSLTPAEQRRYLEIASRHGEHLNRLVGQLFELARLDSESIEPHLESFSLAELIQDITQKYRLEAEGKGVSLEARLTPEAACVQADIGLMERVFENLIENALRYTPPGGNVVLSLDTMSECVRVAISDTGEGISESDLPHVFDRLYRASQKADPNGMHAGLGLAIVKRILELHGCAVSVNSKAKVGTTFTFDLPAPRAA